MNTFKQIAKIIRQQQYENTYFNTYFYVQSRLYGES